MIYDVVFPYWIGGAEHRYYAIASQLSEKHEISIYGFNYWREDPSRCLPQCRYISVGEPIPIYNSKRQRYVSEAILFALRLVRPLLESREELWDIASTPYFSVLTARLISFIRRKPMVVTWHEYWGNSWYDYMGWKGIFGIIIEKLALFCSPKIIAVSNFTKRRLLSAGCPEKKITVIPNSISLAKINKVLPSHDSTDLIYVGRLVPYKQVALLIKALKILHESNQKMTLCIIGDGPDKDDLLKLTNELSLEKHVRFLGFLPSSEEVYAWLKSSRVLVLPSKREGFGIAILEAWACGIPVVVCSEPNSALPDLIDSDVKGRVVYSEPHAIAKGCMELLAEQKEILKKKLSEEVAPYDLKIIAAHLEKIYQHVYKNHQRITGRRPLGDVKKTMKNDSTR